MTFAELLADACERLNVSQSELARRYGCDPSMVNQLLTGKTATKLGMHEHTFKDFAHALGLDVRVELVRKR